MSTPDVTIIIGVYNAMPYLIKCMSSVLDQTIGADRVEVIAVDDGSTDDSGTQLDLFRAAHPHLRVIHQENSGGPSRPRNVGLDHATGRYVFFLDADDHLGPESMQRLVTMADANNSDIVLGRIAGINGRKVATAPFRRTEPKVDLHTSAVYYTLTSQKLFRRSLIENHGLRFPEDLHIGEDQLFTAPAYFHASVISVVADYDCYYLRLRDDGDNLTARLDSSELRVDVVERMLPFVARHTEPGAQRDHLSVHHFRQLAGQAFGPTFLDCDGVTRQDLVRRAGAVLAAWYTPGVRQRLRPPDRVKFDLIARGRTAELAEFVAAERAGAPVQDVVDGGRIYAAHTFFRDPRAGVPDDCFEVTEDRRVHHHLDTLSWKGTVLRLSGHAYIDHVDTVAPRTELVLREHDSQVEHRLATRVRATPELTADHGQGRYDYGRAGFVATIDVTRAAGGQPLPAGRWDIYLAVSAQSVAPRKVRLGHARSATIAAAPRTRIVPAPTPAEPVAESAESAEPVAEAMADGTIVTTYFTTPKQNLTLEIGEIAHHFAPDLKIDLVRWSSQRPAALLITGRVALGRPGDLPGAMVNIVLTGRGGAVHRVRAELASGSGTQGFVATVPLATAAAGRPLGYGGWAFDVELDVCGVTRRRPVSAAPHALPEARWRRYGLASRATADSTDPLIIELAPAGAGALVRRPFTSPRR